jgi:hypothetical protein
MANASAQKLARDIAAAVPWLVVLGEMARAARCGGKARLVMMMMMMIYFSKLGGMTEVIKSSF